MNKEQVYDQLISPLMDQIIKVCSEHKIGVLAVFPIPTPEDSGLQVSTCLPGDDEESNARLMRGLQHAAGCTLARIVASNASLSNDNKGWVA